MTPIRGDTVILRPGDTHSAYPNEDEDKGHRVCDIYVSKTLFTEICNNLDSELFQKISQLPDPPMFHLTGRYLHDFECRITFPFLGDTLTPKAEDEKLLEIVKKSIVTELVGQYVYNYFNTQRALPACLINLIRHFHNPAYQDASIESIAAFIGYSHTYLCRTFREYFGKTIQEYIQEERVEKSIVLLQSGLSVKQIAARLGWKNTNNYINAFRKIYNVTPGKYKNDTKKIK